MKLTEKQSYIIQLVRGIAIIAVVMIHTAPAGITQVFCRPFLNIGVASFLFLSGLLSQANNWHPWKRIKKVAIPYVIWSLIYVLVYNRRLFNAPISLIYIYI